MRIAGIFISILLILNSIIVSIYTAFAIGNMLSAFIGIALLIYILFYNKIKKHAPKYIQTAIKVCMGTFAITFLFSTLIIYKNSVTAPPPNANAVIVLGAGLRGENVSLTLAHRLDAAMEYHKQNPESIIVVSGGQGQNEVIAEALAMKNYLVGKGLDENCIIMEDKSSRTVENFHFSKTILDNYFGNTNYTTVYVTNGFHILRAGLIAKQAGIDGYGLSCQSVSYLEPTNYLREYFSLIKYFVLDR